MYASSLFRLINNATIKRSIPVKQLGCPLQKQSLDHATTTTRDTPKAANTEKQSTIDQALSWFVEQQRQGQQVYFRAMSRTFKPIRPIYGNVALRKRYHLLSPSFSRSVSPSAPGRQTNNEHVALAVRNAQECVLMLRARNRAKTKKKTYHEKTKHDRTKKTKPQHHRRTRRGLFSLPVFCLPAIVPSQVRPGRRWQAETDLNNNLLPSNDLCNLPENETVYGGSHAEDGGTRARKARWQELKQKPKISETMIFRSRLRFGFVNWEWNCFPGWYAEWEGGAG